MWEWIRDAYRGYLWPWLIFFPAVGYGSAWNEHGAWHYAMWPCLTVSLVALSTTASKMAKK